MSNDLIKANENTSIVNIAQMKAEIEVLMEAASMDKREIKSFMHAAIDLATYNEDIAASCIFSLPRKAKNKKTGAFEEVYIKGKSIRLAEIIFSVYKNIKVDVRIAQIGIKTVTAIASCIDLQNKTFFSEEAIVNINGTHSDASKLAIGAAKSIAIRNAIFRLVPGAFSDEIYRKAVECAVGNQKTFPERRRTIFERIAKLGIPQERIFAFYGKTCVEDFTHDNMEEIIGIGSAIKEGELKIDKAFTKNATSSDSDDLSDELSDFAASKTSDVTIEKKPDTKNDAEVINTTTGEILPSQFAVDHIALKKQIENAKSQDTLAIAADLIAAVDPQYQLELAELYRKRNTELKG
jgi:predicted ester cyclase